MPSSRRWRSPAFLWLGLAGLVFGLSACRLGAPPGLITVYSPALKISIPVPQGWRSEVGEQSSFLMQIFTGPSVDVPERPGIRAQVMKGPLPVGVSLDDLSTRYTEGHTVSHEQGYSLHGIAGKSWYFYSEDGAERSRLMLTPVDGRLYGLYVHGEAATMEAYDSTLDAMWEGFSIEEARFFEPYERPEVGLFLKHPHSWERTSVLGKAGKALFVAFRSPPLLLEEAGTSIHSTLEVIVNTVEPGTTLESFYAKRTEIQGDNYRLLDHDTIRGGDAISDLYHAETQLADYLERTIYFVRGDKSYLFKFNAQNVVYHQIEVWIDEMVQTFEPRETS